MDDLKQPHDKHDETPKCCYGWLMKPACLDDCPHATEAAKKLLMHRLSYPATASATPMPKALKLLEEAAHNLYNSFEPDNQSALWLRINAYLKSGEYVHDEVKK